MNYTKRIIVTGGCGYIGGHLVRHLVKTHKDWLIINLDCLSYAGIIENVVDLEEEPNYRFEYGDVQDEFFLSAVFTNYAVTDVIHLAASSHVDRSVSAPMEFLYNNTIGSVCLLEAARLYWSHNGGFEGHRFYYFSTDEVFGFLNETEPAFTETSRINPSSPYSASKASADIFASAYFKTYGLPVITSHCCNVYGGYQFPEKMIPATIQRIVDGEEIIVYDKGLQRREWIYMDDVISAAETVFEKGVPGQAYNIGSGFGLRNIDLVNILIDIVCEKIGKDPEEVRKTIKYVENARPGHDFRYAINHQKITKELGWRPVCDFDGSIKKTVDWYLNNQDWVNSIKSGEYKKNNEKYTDELPW